MTNEELEAHFRALGWKIEHRDAGCAIPVLHPARKPGARDARAAARLAPECLVE